MKIPSVAQVRKLDQDTISKHYNSSLELMEKAAQTFVDWFIQLYPEKDLPIYLFCGTGNNGGDGLAIARLLNERFYTVEIYYCKIGKASADNNSMLEKLPQRSGIKLYELKESGSLPEIKTPGIIIDAIFGTGLSRVVGSYWKNIIKYINSLQMSCVAVDIPSGVWQDADKNDPIVTSQRTLSFEFPKLQFLVPTFSEQVGEWEYASIGLDKEAIEELKVDNYYITNEMAKAILKPRKKYSHKGTYGHALLIMGKHGMYGAALLAAQASLRSGLGKLTIHAPETAFNILQTALPEAMVSIDRHAYHFSTPPYLNQYQAIGIGCGLGTAELTKDALVEVLDSEVFSIKGSAPALLLDADALNIISEDKSLLEKLPRNTILTPHPGECERLFGASISALKQLEELKEQANKYQIYIILKRAHTAVICPDKTCYFNSTGNPGMATAGSGDILSGIITGFLAQGYTAKEASILGVYIHGLAGDLAVEHFREQEALIARDIIEFMGNAFKKIRTV